MAWRSDTSQRSNEYVSFYGDHTEDNYRGI